MKQAQRRAVRASVWPTRWLWAMPCLGVAIQMLMLAPAQAQDVRGMQICTVEKQMERRTSCLQANVEFLQQALLKQSREMQARLDSESKTLAAARTEIETLQSTVKKLQGELAKLQAKPNPPSKK
jgi:septal ring factor EnvC (AmiA/AmiB activator)